MKTKYIENLKKQREMNKDKAEKREKMHKRIELIQNTQLKKF